MRLAWILVAIVGCAPSHPPAVDRADCSRCHTAPVAAVPAPSPCVSPDNPHPGGTADVARCARCHGTFAWCPAEATHVEFSLEDGHAGWDCADCHRVESISYEAPASVTDPTQITCISCHWHSADRTDPFHLGNGDYTYGEATCRADGCHEGTRP